MTVIADGNALNPQAWHRNVLHDKASAFCIPCWCAWPFVTSAGCVAAAMTSMWFYVAALSIDHSDAVHAMEGHGFDSAGRYEDAPTATTFPAGVLLVQCPVSCTCILHLLPDLASSNLLTGRLDVQ